MYCLLSTRKIYFTINLSEGILSYLFGYDCAFNGIGIRFNGCRRLLRSFFRLEHRECRRFVSTNVFSSISRDNCTKHRFIVFTKYLIAIIILRYIHYNLVQNQSYADAIDLNQYNIT